MENVSKFETSNIGVVNSTPNTESSLNDSYMTSQNDCKAPVEVKAEEPKLYIFRKLNSTDLFPMVKIISKIGVDELATVFDGDVIKNLVSKVKGEASESADDESAKKESSQLIVGIGVALKMANKILEHIPTCENEIYTLLSNVSGMDIAAVKVLDLDVFLEMIMEFIMKEEFKNFFKVASKYIKA